MKQYVFQFVEELDNLTLIQLGKEAHTINNARDPLKIPQSDIYKQLLNVTIEEEFIDATWEIYWAVKNEIFQRIISEKLYSICTP